LTVADSFRLIRAVPAFLGHEEIKFFQNLLKTLSQLGCPIEKGQRKQEHFQSFGEAHDSSD